MLATIVLATIVLATIVLATIVLATIVLATIVLATIVPATMLATMLATIMLTTIVLATIVLTTIVLATIVLATIVLATIVLATIVLATIVLATIVLATIVLATIVLATIVLATIVLATIVLATIVLATIKLATIVLATIVLATIVLATNWEYRVRHPRLLLLLVFRRYLSRLHSAIHHHQLSASLSARKSPKSDLYRRSHAGEDAASWGRKLLEASGGDLDVGGEEEEMGEATDGLDEAVRVLLSWKKIKNVANQAAKSEAGQKAGGLVKNVVKKGGKEALTAAVNAFRSGKGAKGALQAGAGSFVKTAKTMI
ncbi:unnamed protein product [Closterium sp. Naga37s-1]|nr:unnamed protein product [Closterium sp. Naga37s-1]